MLERNDEILATTYTIVISALGGIKDPLLRINTYTWSTKYVKRKETRDAVRKPDCGWGKNGKGFHKLSIALELSLVYTKQGTGIRRILDQRNNFTFPCPRIAHRLVVDQSQC